jgi:hypothetical protein
MADVMKIPVESCGICTFHSHEGEPLVPVCRRYPPVADKSFVKVDPHSWCGEFEQIDFDDEDPEYAPFVLVV